MKFDKLTDAQIRSNYQHRHVIDFFIKNFRGKRVLDAGCWTGTLEKELSQRKLKLSLVGIDENKAALNVAAKNFPKFEFVRQDLVHPDPAFVKKYTGYFDTIVCLDVIEHVPAESEAVVLRFFSSLLRPTGKLILSTMLSHRYNFIDPAWFLGHRHYSVKHLLKLLDFGGFRSEKTLKLGNLYWDLDILLLYIYKHIFNRNYKTSNFIYKRILHGLSLRQKNATRIYLIAKKTHGY